MVAERSHRAALVWSNLMSIDYRNRAFIKSKYPEIFEALEDFGFFTENLANQTNSDPRSAAVAAPPAISKLTVTAAQGVHEIAIEDNTSPVVRGINYYAEYSPSKNFSQPTVIDLGSSRNYRKFLGNQTLFWRAYSSYPNSARSEPVYHGAPNNPFPVIGGGAITGPTLAPSNGSGTAQGADGSDGGFGNQPFRGKIRPQTRPA
jgi:hypothetical protein